MLAGIQNIVYIFKYINKSIVVQKKTKIKVLYVTNDEDGLFAIIIQ